MCFPHPRQHLFRVLSTTDPNDVRSETLRLRVELYSLRAEAEHARAVETDLRAQLDAVSEALKVTHAKATTASSQLAVAVEARSRGSVAEQMVRYPLSRTANPPCSMF